MRLALPMILALILLPALAACTRFPELDARPGRAPADTPYPALVPLEDLLAGAALPGRAEAAGASLESRAALLRRRAAALRGQTVAEGAERLRQLEAGSAG